MSIIIYTVIRKIRQCWGATREPNDGFTKKEVKTILLVLNFFLFLLSFLGTLFAKPWGLGQSPNYIGINFLLYYYHLIKYRLVFIRYIYIIYHRCITCIFMRRRNILKKKNTCNVYQKHLDLDKRIKIEKGIEEHLNFTQIAKEINKSPRTVSYRKRIFRYH